MLGLYEGGLSFNYQYMNILKKGIDYSFAKHYTFNLIRIISQNYPEIFKIQDYRFCPSIDALISRGLFIYVCHCGSFTGSWQFQLFKYLFAYLFRYDDSLAVVCKDLCKKWCAANGDLSQFSPDDLNDLSSVQVREFLGLLVEEVK